MSISREFVTAGNATFTIELPEARKSTGDTHYTYLVEKVEDTRGNGHVYFVRVLTGPNNESDYTYLGMLDAFTGYVRLTRKSSFPETSFRYRLLNRVLARVWSDDHSAYEQFGFRTHHEGLCGRCGRKLTVPSSVESGIGPECAKKLAG